MAPKRKDLLIKDRIKLIDEHDRKYTSERQLASKYGISKSQVHRILANKENYKQQAKYDGQLKRRRINRKFFFSKFLIFIYNTYMHECIFNFIANLKYEDVDKAVLTWFCTARSKNIPIDGTIIREKALNIAKAIDPNTSFTASSGWLSKFVGRHNIKFKVLSGQGASINDAVVNDWFGQLPGIIAQYSPCDIYNMDETGLFYKQTPNKSYVKFGEMSKGGANSKLRLTVALFANWAGAKENPIIIGNAKRPRSFGRIDIEKTHNVVWRSNKKSWMTAVIFNEILVSFNRKMRLEGRNVLLFLDNASCHPDVELSNVKLIFLPPNTTSKCQPLDQGIIQSFKVQYRKQLVEYIISMIDENIFLTNINSKKLPEITVLNAITWIKTAWDRVSPDTIVKCFRRCGFHNNDLTENDLVDPGMDFGLDNFISPEETNAFLNFDNDASE